QQKAPVVPPGFAAQGNSQLETVLKNFMQETQKFDVDSKNQILAQGYERPSVGDIVTESNPKGTTEEHSVSEPNQSLSPATKASPEAVQKSKSDKTSVDSEVAKPSGQVMIRERPPPPFPHRL
ncbi:hypothetical protein A2U01_0038253, partial [Trifolium medium]|nr:hypothetical protein [Trifolium medium]